MLGIVSSPILASLREQELQLVRREAPLRVSEVDRFVSRGGEIQALR